MGCFGNNFGRIFVGGLLASSLLAGCGSSNEALNQPTGQQVTPATPIANQQDDGIPGIAGDHVVFRFEDELILVSEIEVEWFLSRTPGAVRVPGARIVYPDGSEQITDANGEFDSSLSSYAPRVLGVDFIDRPETAVTIVAPTALGLDSQEFDVLVMSPQEEAASETTFVEPDDTTQQPAVPGPMALSNDIRAQYVFSDQQSDYLAAIGRFETATWDQPIATTPLSMPFRQMRHEMKFTFRSIGADFKAHAYLAGTSQPVDPAELSVTSQKTSISGDLLEARWTVTAWRSNHVRGQRAAIWCSPSIYFGVLGFNVHLTLLDF